MNYSLESMLEKISDPIAKVMAKAAYEFTLKYGDGGEKAAYEKGLGEVDRLGMLREEAEKPQTFINLSTGERFVSTEREMMERDL